VCDYTLEWAKASKSANKREGFEDKRRNEPSWNLNLAENSRHDAGE
jgi:hypothetical protein